MSYRGSFGSLSPVTALVTQRRFNWEPLVPSAAVSAAAVPLKCHSTILVLHLLFTAVPLEQINCVLVALLSR